MRLAPLLVAASSGLLALGTRQSLATPREPALAPTAWSTVVPAVGIPRFRARPQAPPTAPAWPTIDTALTRRPGRDARACPMPVAGIDVGVRPRAEVVEVPPAPMPVAPSACVNPLGR